MSGEPRGEERWDGDDLKPGKAPDKDHRPDIPDRPEDEEPPRNRRSPRADD